MTRNRAVLPLDVANLAVDVRERDAGVRVDPSEFVLVGDLELERQRAIRSVLVLPNETVSLEPTGQCRFGCRKPVLAVDDIELSRKAGGAACQSQNWFSDFRAMRMEMQTHPKLQLI